MLIRGTVLSDRYEIIERIGSGGMADVYRATDRKLNRYVAIKVLKKEYSDDRQFVAKFRSEARAAAAISNPNIVNVYDVGEENGRYYIVLELIEGITLKKYIEKKGRLDYREAIGISIQIANGMEAAHDHHVIHRDIKPQNIIISKEGKVKVTDFGIARVASSTTTVASNAIGSVHYMSPEQARGGYMDEKSDIYSFGVTLFEMLTGQVPFDGDSTVEVAVHHIQDEIEPPSEYMSGIPISVDKIVQKCTRKKPEQRYQSVKELVSDLKKALIMPNVDFINSEITTETAKADGKPAEADREETSELTDISDDENEKLDGVMKWIGIGIAAAIVVVIIIVIATMSSSGNRREESVSTSEATTEEARIVEVPSVEGKNISEATSELTALGLDVKVTYDSTSRSESGTVLSQSVRAGSRISVNSRIILRVAGRDPDANVETGAQTEAPTQATEAPTESNYVTVPSVVGYSQTGAMNAITSLGLGYRETSSEYSDTVPWGCVISQSPEAGTNVQRGYTIITVISKGSDPNAPTATTETEEAD